MFSAAAGGAPLLQPCLQLRCTCTLASPRASMSLISGLSGQQGNGTLYSITNTCLITLMGSFCSVRARSAARLLWDESACRHCLPALAGRQRGSGRHNSDFQEPAKVNDLLGPPDSRMCNSGRVLAEHPCFMSVVDAECHDLSMLLSHPAFSARVIRA